MRPGTITAVTAQLDRDQISYSVLDDGGIQAVVVPSQGAKVVAAGSAGANFFWTPGEIRSRKELQEQWVAGGERTWIAPEGGDHGLFYGHDVDAWSVPPMLDPGDYRIVDQSSTGIRLTSSLTLTDASGSILLLDLERRISVVWHDEPLGHGVISVGTVFRNAGSAALPALWAPWAICQVPSDPPGVLFSVVSPRAEAGDPEAYRPIFGDANGHGIQQRGSAIVVPSQGGRKLKIGISGRRSLGCNGHVLRHGDTQRWVVQRWNVTTDACYVDADDAAQLFNAPTLGDEGFSEIEAHAGAVALEPGMESVLDIDYILADTTAEHHDWLRTTVGADPAAIIDGISDSSR